MQVEAQKKNVRLYNVSDQYEVIQKIGKGTYGTVYKTKSKSDKRNYAIKKLQNNDPKLQLEGFPITALRQIMLLKQMNHPNIIGLRQIVLSKPSKRNLMRGSTFLVLQYMDHDLAGLLKNNIKFTLPQIKCIMKQLLLGVEYLHKQRILHRDIKPANILLNDQGSVKIADFGLGRKFMDCKNMTCKVVTLWYRAPELILKYRKYDSKIDIWSIGCVFAQFFTREVLFKKDNQYSQLDRIIQLCGDYSKNSVPLEVIKQFKETITQKNSQRKLENHIISLYPNITYDALDLLSGLLDLNPLKRLSCTQALQHPFFTNSPLPCKPSEITQCQYQFHDMVKQFIKIDKQPHNQKDKKQRGKNRNLDNYSNSSRISENSSKSISQKKQTNSSNSRDNSRSRNKSKSHYTDDKRNSRDHYYKYNDRYNDKYDDKYRNRQREKQRDPYNYKDYKDRDWDRNKDRDRQYRDKDREDRNRGLEKEKDRYRQKQREKQKQFDKYQDKSYKQHDRDRQKDKDKTKDRYPEERPKDRNNYRDKQKNKQYDKQKSRRYDKQSDSQDHHRHGSRQKQRQKDRDRERERERDRDRQRERERERQRQREREREREREKDKEKDRDKDKDRDYKSRRQNEDRYYKKQNQSQRYHSTKYNKQKYYGKQQKTSRGYQDGRQNKQQKNRQDFNQSERKQKIRQNVQDIIKNERVDTQPKSLSQKALRYQKQSNNFDKQKSRYEKPRYERYDRDKDRQRGERGDRGDRGDRVQKRQYNKYDKYDKRSESEERRKHHHKDGKNRHQKQKYRRSNSNSQRSRSREKKNRPEYDY